jgi:hypothetical protein
LYVRKKLVLPTEEHTLSHTDLYQIIFKQNIKIAFPNVETIMRLFLILVDTNCSG